jgi:hypothetical protein
LHQVISRALLSRPKDEQKLQLEIALHEQLSHHHIVRCLGHFVDENNIYLMLEHCCECHHSQRQPVAQAAAVPFRERKRDTTADRQQQSLSVQLLLYPGVTLHNKKGLVDPVWTTPRHLGMRMLMAVCLLVAAAPPPPPPPAAAPSAAAAAGVTVDDVVRYQGRLTEQQAAEVLLQVGWNPPITCLHVVITCVHLSITCLSLLLVTCLL